MAKTKHKNEEKVVKCPVEGCDHEGLSRGMHLHVRQSSGNGHGPNGDVPDGLDFSNLEVVGTKEVEMDYPSERKGEDVARLCPFCRRPFNGYQGVMIHLGQIQGKENHPEDAADMVDRDDCPVAHVDENRNVIEVVEQGDPDLMPSTEERRDGSVPRADVIAYIEWAESNDQLTAANKAREMLL
jgi:hypothetical protein